VLHLHLRCTLHAASGRSNCCCIPTEGQPPNAPQRAACSCCSVQHRSKYSVLAGRALRCCGARPAAHASPCLVGLQAGGWDMSHAGCWAMWAALRMALAWANKAPRAGIDAGWVGETACSRGAAQCGAGVAPGLHAGAAAARAPVSCRGTPIPTPARLAPSRGAWSARPLGGAPCLHDRTGAQPPTLTTCRFDAPCPCAAMLRLTPTCCQPVDCPLVRAIRLPRGRILHLWVLHRAAASPFEGQRRRRAATARAPLSRGRRSLASVRRRIRAPW
jgi:hypothetical protein